MITTTLPPRPPAPDAVRVYRVLDLARAHANAFNMNEWADFSRKDFPSGRIQLSDLTHNPPCGTTACLAGWIVLDAGLRMDEFGLVESRTTYLGTSSVVAAHLLGITHTTAWRLFHADASELDEIVMDIFGPRPTESVEVTA